MKRKIVIEPYHEAYTSVNYYLIRFKDEEESEFDKFFNNFDGDEDFEDEFNTIIEWLAVPGNLAAFSIMDSFTLQAILFNLTYSVVFQPITAFVTFFINCF